nr:hypothetical protein [Tanacetum cinerariifolium]
MATTIKQQVALDEALVPGAQRLRIGRSNFRLPSDIQSKESTLQVVYDVLRRSPFFKAFLVTADVPEIYMQEFWATAYVHQHSIRFKMDTRKNIIDLEAFRDMLHISPRVPGQSFAELPFEEEILEFLRFLGHSAEIKTLTDVNVNKLFQPWRSFAAVINKCLTGKSGSASSTTPPTPIATLTPLAAPRLTVAAKGKQPARATSPTEPLDVERTEAEQLKIVLRRSRHETHISQQGGSSTDEGTGMESISMTGSSFVTPIPSPKSTMTPSIITTTTTTSQLPIPPTPILSDVLQTLPTFASVFRFEDRVKSLEVNFSEFMRTNQSTEAVFNIPGIVHQYMHQEMTEAIREAVQKQTLRLQDSLQIENDEFLRTIDDNMKKIIMEQVKNQVKAQVTRILPRIISLLKNFICCGDYSLSIQIKFDIKINLNHGLLTN